MDTPDWSFATDRSDIGSVQAIEELEVAEQQRIEEHILQIPDLAPAMWADHHVGTKPVRFRSSATRATAWALKTPASVSRR